MPGQPGQPGWPPSPSPQFGQPIDVFQPSTGTVQRAPRRKVRLRWIIIGAILGVVAVLVLIGGAIMSLASRTASSLDPVAEARTPGTATFEAEATSYDILLVRGRGQDFREASDLTCQVTLADGKELEIDGRFQDVSERTANIETVGDFDAVAGTTSVFCEARGGEVRFVIDDESTLHRIGMLMVFGGVGGVVIAAVLILLGVFWKKTVPA